MLLERTKSIKGEVKLMKRTFEECRAQLEVALDNLRTVSPNCNTEILRDLFILNWEVWEELFSQYPDPSDFAEL